MTQRRLVRERDEVVPRYSRSEGPTLEIDFSRIAEAFHAAINSFLSDYLQAGGTGWNRPDQLHNELTALDQRVQESRSRHVYYKWIALLNDTNNLYTRLYKAIPNPSWKESFSNDPVGKRTWLLKTAYHNITRQIQSIDLYEDFLNNLPAPHYTHYIRRQIPI